MCFSTYLEEEKKEHIHLLEFIKVYETLRDNENTLYQLVETKDECEAALQSVDSNRQIDHLVSTLKDLDQEKTELTGSIEEARMLLSEMFETNKDSFYQCFHEFNSTMLGGSNNNKYLPQRLQPPTTEYTTFRLENKIPPGSHSMHLL